LLAELFIHPTHILIYFFASFTSILQHWDQ